MDYSTVAKPSGGKSVSRRTAFILGVALCVASLAAIALAVVLGVKLKAPER